MANGWLSKVSVARWVYGREVWGTWVHWRQNFCKSELCFQNWSVFLRHLISNAGGGLCHRPQSACRGAARNMLDGMQFGADSSRSSLVHFQWVQWVGVDVFFSNPFVPSVPSVNTKMPRKPGMTRDDLFNINADIAKGVVEACAKFCPEAVRTLAIWVAPFGPSSVWGLCAFVLRWLASLSILWGTKHGMSFWDWWHAISLSI